MTMYMSCESNILFKGIYCLFKNIMRIFIFVVMIIKILNIINLFNGICIRI